MASQVTYTASPDTLVLPNVDLGNIRKIKTGQVELNNVNGEPIILKQSYWPTIYTLSYRFNNLCPLDLLAVIDFLATTLGKQITLTDHEGLGWLGVITTPQAELTNLYSETVTIDFEGNRS